MSIDTLPIGIPPELVAELEAAAAQAGRGIRDPQAARKAAADMDRIREAVRQRHGVLDIGGPAIRELRDA
jgi:hypothetical protein